MEGGATTKMTAKLPILNLGEYDLWLMRIEQLSEQTYEPTIAEEKQDRRNEIKARGTLLMALPNKDQLKFHSYQDAKLLLEAIEKRYGRNKESKKGEVLHQEDMNLKLLRSLPSEWKTHALIWRNKAELETINLEQIDLDDLKEMDLHWEMAMLTIKARSDKSKAGLGYKEQIPESFVKSSELLEKQTNRSTKGYHEVPPPLIRNYIPPKRDLRLIDEHIKSESVDVSTVSSSVDKTVDITHKGVLITEEPKSVMKNNFGPIIIEDWHSNNDSEGELSPTVKVKTIKPSAEKIEFVKTLGETVKTVESHKPHKHYPRGNKRNWNNLMSQRLGRNFKMINKACYVCGSFEHLQYVCDKKDGNPHQKEYKEKGVINSGCSRHMKGNKCYLTDFEDFDGGFVSFGDGKGRISGKGKIKTRKLDFNDVYFCKELKYNLFNVSNV
nr:ribonuclease H-like domain-containing protein [Tanacetum cinerariifolium]